MLPNWSSTSPHIIGRRRRQDILLFISSTSVNQGYISPVLSSVYSSFNEISLLFQTETSVTLLKHDYLLQTGNLEANLPETAGPSSNI